MIQQSVDNGQHAMRLRRDARKLRREARRDGTLRRARMPSVPVESLTPEEQEKRDAEWELVFKEYARIGAICRICKEENSFGKDEVQNNCDFNKLKGCTQRTQIKNSLGPAKELIRCPKKLLYEE